MENNITIVDQVNNEQSSKKTYTSPELKKYGSLSELVHTNPGGGGDGGVVGCTLS